MRHVIVCLCGFLLGNVANAGGTLENHQFFSNALQEERWVQVYLPEGYDPTGSAHYPVVYFLHGSVGDDHTSYPQLITALDDVIAEELIDPVIVVKPDGGGCGPWWFFTGCNWVNSSVLGNYEDYVVQDVVAWAEAHFPIIPSRTFRMIMGHSMGGFGAMHIALKHPDMFGGVAAHSGYTHFDDFDMVHRPLLIAEQPGSPPYEWSPVPGRLFTCAWFMLASGYSPNASNPSHYVDFPLDGQGELIPSVWSRWLDHDPARLALGLTPTTQPAIYFDCGTNDDFVLHSFNEHFDEDLTDLGLAHDWQSYVGDHASYLHLRFPIGLQFLDAAMGNPASVDEASIGLEPLVSFSRGPTFARGCAQIDFVLSRAGHVSLKVYDVRGGLVANPLDRSLGVGLHHAYWNAADVPSGVYYYVLEPMNRAARGRMLIAK